MKTWHMILGVVVVLYIGAWVEKNTSLYSAIPGL